MEAGPWASACFVELGCPQVLSLPANDPFQRANYLEKVQFTNEKKEQRDSSSGPFRETRG
jgi:hypothetical protein